MNDKVLVEIGDKVAFEWGTATVVKIEAEIGWIHFDNGSFTRTADTGLRWNPARELWVAYDQH